MARALGCEVTVRIKPTVNPLQYQVEVHFPEIQPGKVMLPLWNMAQEWMTKNDASPQGRPILAPQKLVFGVVVKHRLGPPKKNTP